MLLSQIRQQLAQNWKDDLHHSVSAVSSSPMNKQLTYQTEYNTSLLAQIEELEAESQRLRLALAAAESGRAEMREGGRETEQRVDDLHRKLTISSQLCDRLSLQCTELRENNSQLDAQCAGHCDELNSTRQKYHDLLSENARVCSRVQELEMRVEASEAGRSWQGSEDKARTDALNESVEKFTVELAEAHSRIATLERDLSHAAEDGMELQHKYDRLHMNLEAEISLKQSLQRELSDVSFDLHRLQVHTKQLELDRKESIESREVQQLEMTCAERAQQLAAEMSHRADQKWRQLEEVVRNRERELVVAAEDNERLERLVSNLEKKMRHAEVKWLERERLVKSELTFQSEQATTKETELRAQLDESRLVIAKEQNRCEVLSNNLISQQTEMSSQLLKMRSIFEDKISEVNVARDEAHLLSQVLRREMEAVVTTHDEKMLRLQTEIEQLSKKNFHLKEVITARGEQFATTLELLQAAVRQCGQEASEWKLKNSYLSSQLCKLLDVLQNLSVSQPTANSMFAGMTPVSKSSTGSRVSLDNSNLPEDSILDSVPIALRPIRIYGDEIRRSFKMFAQRISTNSAVIGDLRSELKKTKGMLDENVFALDEERSELFATKKMVASLKSKMAELERDKSGSQRGHKDQLYMLEAARDAALRRAEKAEDRTLDLTRQLTLLQAEVTKYSAELKAVQTSYNAETNKLEGRVGENESLAGAMKKEYQELRRRYDEIVTENKKESEQRIRIREELKRCRDVAHDTATSFVSEKEKMQGQIASMTQMLGHYEVQLKQKESLLEVIKSQRTELSAELQKLRVDDKTSTEHFQRSARGDENCNSAASPNAHGSSLNSLHPTTAVGYTFHSTNDIAARDALSGYSNKLKHLTQSVKQMETQKDVQKIDASLDISFRSAVGNTNQSFRIPALDPEGSVEHMTSDLSQSGPNIRYDTSSTGGRARESNV